MTKAVEGRQLQECRRTDSFTEPTPSTAEPVHRPIAVSSGDREMTAPRIFVGSCWVGFALWKGSGHRLR